ncbi:unnamed protein product [Alopecurus aequalis]
MALLEPTISYLPGTFASTSKAVANMLRRWNYKEGSGLGARGQGIVAPVQPAVQRRRRKYAGLGYHPKRRDNGLPDKAPPPPVVEDECADLSQDLGLEVKCCDKTIALLRAMAQEDDGVETAAALAAVVKSRKVFKRKRTPGMWKASLPPSTVHYIVEHAIKPRMAVDVQEWMPSWCCEDWVRPWIPLIGHLPKTLYQAVETKIAKHAHDYDVISPWKQYFDPAQWGTFSEHHVLPWLTRLVREVMITPPKQVDRSFCTVMLWAPLVSVQNVVSILETEQFFERWEAALRHWRETAAKPSSEEAVAWCTGWKNLFTPELLGNDRVLARLDSLVASVDPQA